MGVHGDEVAACCRSVNSWLSGVCVLSDDPGIGHLSSAYSKGRGPDEAKTDWVPTADAEKVDVCVSAVMTAVTVGSSGVYIAVEGAEIVY